MDEGTCGLGRSLLFNTEYFVLWLLKESHYFEIGSFNRAEGPGLLHLSLIALRCKLGILSGRSEHTGRLLHKATFTVLNLIQKVAYFLGRVLLTCRSAPYLLKNLSISSKSVLILMLILTILQHFIVCKIVESLDGFNYERTMAFCV